MSTLRVGVRVLRTERERDDLVKQVACTTCGVGPGWRCDAGTNAAGLTVALATSHTARYLAAVDAGLVPPLPGWPWTG